MQVAGAPFVHLAPWDSQSRGRPPFGATDNQWSAVSDVYSVARDWRDDVYRSLREFAHLSIDWDSYGSPPPSSELVDRAVHLIRQLDPERFVAPTVAPVSGGGVQVCWELERVLDVHFMPDGGIELHIEDLRLGLSSGASGPYVADALLAFVYWVHNLQ